MSPRIESRQNGADINSLNEMQRRFVEYLLADQKFNATTAARKAGYKKPAAASGKLLHNAKIRRIIGKQIRLRRERMQLEADEVLRHLSIALFLDPLDFFEATDDGVTLKQLDDVPLEVRRCVTKLEVRKDGSLKLELMSKDQALVNAMKHLGLIGDGTVNLTNNTVVGDDVLSGLLERAERSRRVIDAEVIRQSIGTNGNGKAGK